MQSASGFKNSWWRRRRRFSLSTVLAVVIVVVACLSAAMAGLSVQAPAAPPPATGKFHLEEATIAGIQRAILSKQLTSTRLVQLYLARIKAYNGTCVRQPQGILGTIEPIPHAGQINALSTLNLRPAARRALGFDDRKARSMTDAVDNDPGMPDALEVAAAQDRQFAETGKLVGPLHGVVIAIKDQYDTFDMRTTSGADAFYANDRPPKDSTFAARLRAAGAIILAKANMGEYAGGDRSSFGGTLCNPYDTERSPGRSSGGSGSSVAANLVTCAIGEESGPSIRNPAKNNNIVGLAPTQELVGRTGMIRASFMNDRVGPMCRSVKDVARILEVMAGYDPEDELTAFSMGRLPEKPYADFADARSLEGVRIGVVREFMNKDLFTQADAQSIDIIERGISDLRKLGATLVDPGPGGALFEDCIKRYQPSADSDQLIAQFPKLFPVDSAGKPAADHIPLLVAMSTDPALFPEGPTIRDIGPERTTGEGRYVLDMYLKARGDANIKSTADLIGKANFYTDVREDSGFNDKKKGLEKKFADKTLSIGGRLQMRFALQQVVMQCMAAQKLDAVTYPTGNVPAPKLGAPTEPNVNGRSPLAWTLLGANGFPAISVPAGFTNEVYDRVRKPVTGVALKAAPPAAGSEGIQVKSATELVGPITAKLPVGIDFLARPFDEPKLLRIAAAYEAATRHRTPPPEFGPVAGEP
jgi:Asp-tRNA(Asn)/Glu-tRNA(Gln) amidotransferase A subunit family amidase